MKFLVLVVFLAGCAEMRDRVEERVMGQRSVVRIEESARPPKQPAEQATYKIFKWGIRVNIPVSF